MREFRMFVVATVMVALLGGVFGVANAAKDKDKKKMDPEKIFAKKDADGDGKLSVEEFLGKAKPDKAEGVKKRFAKLDKDQDGSLSLEEFKASFGGKKGKKKKDADDNN